MDQIANDATAGATPGLDTIEVTPVPSASKKPRKNFQITRENTRKYGVFISPFKIQCKFCHKTASNGVFGFHLHLSGAPEGIGACLAVPKKVKKEMHKVVTESDSRFINSTKTLMEKMKIF